MRCIAATIVATCEISRMPTGSATSTVASSLLSSSATTAETAVRRTSIGCAAFSALDDLDHRLRDGARGPQLRGRTR